MENRVYDSAARGYDKIASLISAGLDSRLRNAMADEVRGGAVVDIGTGTGESAFAILRRSGARTVAAVDPSAKMLERAAFKEPPKEGKKLFLSRASGENLPFRDCRFDCAATAFAIKHSNAPEKFLREARRVLKPGGKLVAMEARIPETAFAGALFRFHIKILTPLAASFFGLAEQYKTLYKSVENFPSHGDFQEMIKSAGFEKVRGGTLLFGTVALCTGEKPAGP